MTTLVVEPDYWSSLPRDILGLISDNIGFIEDYVGFSAVCRAWHVHAADLYPLMRYKLRFGPYYMCGTNPSSNHAELRNPVSDETLTVNFPGSHRCWGSPFGWLITFNPDDLRFSLLNPLTGATIPLPPLPESESQCLTTPGSKAFLTANPDPDDLDNNVVIISSESKKSSLVSPGNGRHEWSHINTDLRDVTCFQGKLYGIQTSGIDRTRIQVVLIERNHHDTPHRLVPVLSLDMSPHHSRTRRRLVDINGQLCLCVRYQRDFKSPFKVFEIDLSGGTLTQIPSLGDHCLFIGEDYTFSCKTSYREPLTKRVKFVSNYLYRYKCREYDSSRCFDVEVWDLSSSEMDDIITCHYPKDSVRSLSSQPHWIFPPVNFRKLEDARLSTISTFEV